MKITLNTTDQKYFDIGVLAMRRSKYFKGFELYKWMYGVAFSYVKAVTAVIDTEKDTPESVINDIFSGNANRELLNTVAPSLYGGKLVEKAVEGIEGNPKNKVSESELIAGDGILKTENGKTELFVYSISGLYNITEECQKADLNAVLSSLEKADRYVILRPSVNMVNFTPSNPESELCMTEKQAAAVGTAYAYLLRGECAQYQTDSDRMNLTPEYNEMRAQLSYKNVEDYASTDWGYVNCAVFTHDVYWQALGEHLPGDLYCTLGLYDGEGKKSQVFRFELDEQKTYTEKEKAAIEAEFMAAIEPGDIIVIRRRCKTGHAMIYVGNGKTIHSGGANLIYANEEGVAVEQREPTLCIHRVKDYLFNKEASMRGHVFPDPDYVEGVIGTAIVRPLLDSSVANTPITEITKARLKMIGLVAEKTANIKPGVTVNPGDEIEYTFTLDNTRTDTITVEISDKIPANTTYISGGDKKEGNNLYWTVTLPANTSAEVSYTVKVNEDALGKAIESKDATVGGVPVKYSDIDVRRTLTNDERNAVISSINELKTEKTELRDIALANEIYRRVLGIDNIFANTNPLTITEGEEGIFTSNGIPKVSDTTVFARNEKGKYYKMLVPTLFGGRYLRSEKYNEWLRTRVAWEYNLVIGDMILGKTDKGAESYMYLGEGKLVDLSTLENDTVDIQTRLDRLLGYKYYFAIVRPSFLIE